MPRRPRRSLEEQLGLHLPSPSGLFWKDLLSTGKAWPKYISRDCHWLIVHAYEVVLFAFCRCSCLPRGWMSQSEISGFTFPLGMPPAPSHKSVSNPAADSSSSNPNGCFLHPQVSVLTGCSVLKRSISSPPPCWKEKKKVKINDGEFPRGSSSRCWRFYQYSLLHAEGIIPVSVFLLKFVDCLMRMSPLIYKPLSSNLMQNLREKISTWFLLNKLHTLSLK